MSDESDEKDRERTSSLLSILEEMKTCTGPFRRFLQEYFELAAYRAAGGWRRAAGSRGSCSARTRLPASRGRRWRVKG